MYIFLSFNLLPSKTNQWTCVCCNYETDQEDFFQKLGRRMKRKTLGSYKLFLQTKQQKMIVIISLICYNISTDENTIFKN